MTHIYGNEFFAASAARDSYLPKFQQNVQSEEESAVKRKKIEEGFMGAKKDLTSPMKIEVGIEDQLYNVSPIRDCLLNTKEPNNPQLLLASGHCKLGFLTTLYVILLGFYLFI